MENPITLRVPVKKNFITPAITSDHYVLGDGNIQPRKILMPGGNWEKYLPVGETQSKNGIDPSSCTAGGTLNAVEALGKLQFSPTFQSDLSERYLSIASGMDGHGGNPHVIAETLRSVLGAIPEVFLPFDASITTLNKYFSPRPLPYALFKIGNHWHNKYDFKHQWLFYGDETLAQKQNLIKQGLLYSPVGVSGFAWSLHADGKYYNDGPDIHWFEICSYVEGQYWLVFDTYEPYLKKLDWNYNFGYAKGYSLNLQLGGEAMPETPPECRFEYIKYLASWFISKFKPA